MEKINYLYILKIQARTIFRGKENFFIICYNNFNESERKYSFICWTRHCRSCFGFGSGVGVRYYTQKQEQPASENKQTTVVTEKNKKTEFILPGSIKGFSILNWQLFSKILTLDGDIAVYADYKRIFFEN